MSMQSYGYSELILDLKKAKKAAPLEYRIMKDTLEESEYNAMEIASMDVSDECKKAIDDFVTKILYELEVEIYPIYVSSEAEGTDFAGDVLWCVMPEYLPAVSSAINGRESWSEFG